MFISHGRIVFGIIGHQSKRSHAGAHAVVDVQKIGKNAHTFGCTVKLIHFFYAEAFFERHPDIGPESVTADILQRRFMIIGLGGQGH